MGASESKPECPPDSSNIAKFSNLNYSNHNLVEGKLHAYTPLIESPKLSVLAKKQVLLKLDNLQPSGSFKIRGIGNLVQHGKANGKKTAVASSAGNAGLAAALACKKMEIPCTVFLPASTPQSAANNIKEYGANVEYFGEIWNDADSEARRRITDNSVLYISPFDHPKIWEGHASIISELKADLRNDKPSLIVCSVGGGGLITGILEGLEKENWQDVPVLAMETKGAESLNAAMQKKELVKLSGIQSIAKSLGTQQVAEQCLAKCLNHPGKVYSKVCNDTETIDSVEQFLGHHRFFVEPSCAATLTACYKPEYLEDLNLSDGPIILIVCGGSAVSMDLLKKWKRNAYS